MCMLALSLSRLQDDVYYGRSSMLPGVMFVNTENNELPVVVAPALAIQLVYLFGRVQVHTQWQQIP